MNKENGIKQILFKQETYLIKMQAENSFIFALAGNLQNRNVLRNYQDFMRHSAKSIRKELKVCDNRKRLNDSNILNLEVILDEIREQKEQITLDLKASKHNCEILEKQFSYLLEDLKISSVKTLFEGNLDLRIFLKEMSNLSLKLEEKINSYE